MLGQRPHIANMYPEEVEQHTFHPFTCTMSSSHLKSVPLLSYSVKVPSVNNMQVCNDYNYAHYEFY